jgi:predicted RecB family nuclease
MKDGQRPVLLGGYAAKQCPVRTHNDFAPVVPTAVWVPSAEVQADFDAGRQFEADVFEELLRLHPQTAVLVDPALRRARASQATVSAMESGIPLVLGGWLPDDTAGGRRGQPDILIRIDGGYLPADIKHHKTISPAKKASKPVSALTEPAQWLEVPGWTASGHYYEDGLQLAHYTRMLQACGFHPGEDKSFGAILGTSLLSLTGAAPGLVFVWHDLSRHRFRVKVAETAMHIVGSAADPAPLVVPIGQKECVGCPYEVWCGELMGPDDPSAAITRNRLGIREWQTLRRLGITTTEALADLDPEDPAFLDDYCPEVTNYSRLQAVKRLRAAIRHARMIAEGLDFEPIAMPVVAPAADIEIDFDIEWDKAERIYQWGLRIRDGQDDGSARYEPVVSFEMLDDESELELAMRVAVLIAGLRAEAQRAGRSIAVYHWHHVEVSKTRKFECVRAALDGVTVDLHDWFTNTFHVRGDASIKAVARFFGFDWTVDDPGGRLSQEKVEIARAGGADAADAREWCLAYNESDVAAQAVIRDGVREMFASPRQ